MRARFALWLFAYVLWLFGLRSKRLAHGLYALADRYNPEPRRKFRCNIPMTQTPKG